jgi:hypothetical protein
MQTNLTDAKHCLERQNRVASSPVADKIPEIKFEIRISKPETNSKSEIQRTETRVLHRRLF